METCANPGCSEPGTNKCAGCKTTPYCGPICQTAHWPTHKESCDGRLRKMGMDHLNKAEGFHREKNWPQLLRHSDLAATKLKQLKDRPLKAISNSLCYKCEALDFLCRHREQLECAKEWYCLWNTKPTDVGAILAAFGLIESCIQNNEYADAHLYASTLYEIINHKYDNKIPEDQRQQYIAKGACFLAKATLSLAQSGGIPPEEKKKAGQKVIELSRKALEISTQLLYGPENQQVACDMGILADALVYFNDVDDDDYEEAIRLTAQAIAIYSQTQGSSSKNVAVAESKLASLYYKRGIAAHNANDHDRAISNFDLSLPHFHEFARINRLIGDGEKADTAAQFVLEIEMRLRQIAIARAGGGASSKDRKA